MIQAERLSKLFTIHQKEPGLKGSLASLFHRQYITNEALKEVSLNIQPGELVGLVGTNGAGKTTLVKILSGVIFPSSGKASVLGFTPWERKKGFRREIALIMGQKAQLWWDLPAADCFLLLREIYELEHQRYQYNLQYLVETLGVQDQLKTQIRRLSLGERMKMELIAALLHEPKVIFLDEPTIGLDITAQRAIRKFILDYRQSHQAAIILTSHYMEDIEALCQRIMIMRKGEFVYDGGIADISNQFTQHRIVTVEFQREVDLSISPNHFPSEYGEILETDGSSMKIKTLRENLPASVTALLNMYPVTDLSVEEEDIGNLIERFMTGRSKR